MKEPKKKYGGYLIAQGDKFTIIAAINKSGNSPFYEYFKELSEKYHKLAKKGIKKRNKINIEFTVLSDYFDKFSDSGPWNNTSQIKSLGDGFYEFKHNQSGLRVPFFYDEMNQKVIVLTHYFNKDEQKTEPKELLRMKNIKKEFDELRK